MNIRFKLVVYGIILGSMVLVSCSGGDNTKRKSGTENQKPNIIYILTDDLGYGDLSCYGQSKFSTPNIDRLAAEGLRFTNHYSGSSVCAPSRSSLLTGLHTGHTPIRGNKEYFPEGQEPLPAKSVTIAEVLKQAGYTTGAFGKWGLGFIGSAGDPNNQGFDEFFGYNCQRQAHRYYPEYLWHNQEKVMLEGNDLSHKVTYAQDVLHEKALAFIKANKDKPFFAYLPYIAPHAELVAPDDSILAKFKGKYPEIPFVAKKGGDYGPDMIVGHYASQETPRAVFAAMIYRIDVYVGQIVELLKAEGIYENTIIMFSSDNGPHQEAGGDPDFFNSNGGLRGYKRDLYEGGIRVPFIVSWPGVTQPGTVTNHISAFWDILPTMAEITGIDVDTIPIDGISFASTLKNDGQQEQHSYLYWEFHERGGRQAVRKGKWKAVKNMVGKQPNRPLELYDLEIDPQEQNNVADKNPEIVKEMMDIILSARTPSELFNFGSTTYSGE